LQWKEQSGIFGFGAFVLDDDPSSIFSLAVSFRASYATTTTTKNSKKTKFHATRRDSRRC
jgi:hypothetical protein